MIVKLTVELENINPNELDVFRKLATDSMSVIVKHTDKNAIITAKGSYDELISVILTATCFKNYQVHLF